MTIGERIRKVRKELGLSQMQLAQMVGMKQASISDLESGKTKGTMSIAEIASALNVRPIWLKTGVGDRNPKHLDGNVSSITRKDNPVPVISWVTAGDWRSALDDRSTYEHITCPAKRYSVNTFALEVRGVSMYDPNGKKSFSDGDIIFVDPQRQAENGDLVIAMHENNFESTFKRLVIEDGKRFLFALNPEWKPRLQEITEDTVIIGVVIAKQSNMSFYD